MKLQDLKPAEGATHKPKRVGRGFGSGHGKTATRGYNGQGQRSGESRKVGFEGGQMPLFRRTPKKHAFVRPERYVSKWAEVNIGAICEVFSGEAPVDPDLLAQAGLVRSSVVHDDEGRSYVVLKLGVDGVRVLGSGDVDKKLVIYAHHFTKGAREKIEAAGGTCILIGDAADAPSGAEA
jgi:large subunit ribosomal protein L15